MKLALAAVAGAVVAFAASRGAADRTSERLDALEASQKQILAELQNLNAPRQGGRQAPSAPANPQLAALMGIPKDPVSVDGAVLGRADAPVTLVEFSDFQCPFCVRHVKQTFDRIKAAYVDTGKVRYVFRQYPIESLHPQAWGAARAAECADRQGKFWQMHTTIFDNQKQMSEADLKGYARNAGVDLAAYDKCVADPAVTAKITRDLEEGSRIGVTGTPMFFIGKMENGKLRTIKRVNGAESFERFQQAIDAVLAGS